MCCLDFNKSCENYLGLGICSRGTCRMSTSGTLAHVSVVVPGWVCQCKKKLVWSGCLYCVLRDYEFDDEYWGTGGRE